MNRKIKKVLLFVPPAFTFKDNLDINPALPLGLGYIAAVLEQMGIEVKVFDCLAEGRKNRQELVEDTVRVGSSLKEIREEIANFNPDLVGVNCLFTRQRRNAHDIFKVTKEINRSILTVMGGAHPTVLPDLVLYDQNVDYVVLGEGERTIVKLIDSLEKGVSLENIDGLGYKKDSLVKINKKQAFIDNLDSLPFPARHLFNMDKYFGLKFSHGRRMHRSFSPIITSRGCPIGCVFCTAHYVWGRRYRMRSPENVIVEMRELKNKYGIRELLIEDDNVTLDTKRAEILFDMMIKERFNFVWDTPNGVAAFALNEHLIDKMKASGCYRLNLAVESGSQRVLNEVIKKPLKLARVEQLIKYARSIDLDVGIFLIMGVPGETIDDIWASFKFAERLGIYNPFISIATPYPGSELYGQCKDKKYISENFDYDNLYISSYSISTQAWSGTDIRRLFELGNLFLKKSYYRYHPFIFFKDVITRLFSNPKKLIRKVKLIKEIPYG